MAQQHPEMAKQPIIPAIIPGEAIFFLYLKFLCSNGFVCGDLFSCAMGLKIKQLRDKMR